MNGWCYLLIVNANFKTADLLFVNKFETFQLIEQGHRYQIKFQLSYRVRNNVEYNGIVVIVILMSNYIIVNLDFIK